MLPTPSVNVVIPVPMDDPLKHQGRIRTTPHVDGQFAAHVYVPIFPVQRLQRLIHGIFETIEGRVQNVHRLVHFKSDELVDESSPGVLTTPPPTLNGVLHLSLTRPIYLRAHQRDMLKQAVKEVANKVPKFSASFASFIVLDNDTKTRNFLALEIGAGHNSCKEMCTLLKPTLGNLRQPDYYADPRFHVSFAWALTTERDASQFTEELLIALEEKYGPALREIEFDIDTVGVYIGKKTSMWQLSTPQQ